MGCQNRFLKLNNRNRVGNGGFSLLEVIISIAILALITIPLLNYFMNSMQSSARMARHQKATMLAQEITESLKAEEKLLNGTNVYPELYIMSGDPEDPLVLTLMDDSGFNRTEGTGKVNYGYDPGNEDNNLFDIRVTLSTDIPANSVERALVYGIDDATDFLIIEQDQMNEALVYFTSAHVAYCGNHPEATVLSQDDIKSRLDRWICIDISYAADKYTMRVYYDYIATDSKVTGAAGQHLEEGKSFVSSNLIEARVTTLKNIYLLYDLISGSEADTVYLTLNGLPSDFSGTDLYLLCQNLSDKGSSYTLSYSGDSDPKIDFYDNTDEDDNPLVQTGTPVRMIMITTEVYEKGHADSGDDPLATMTTTKGE